MSDIASTDLIDFRSDNTAPVSPAILAAIQAELAKPHDPYGEDDLTHKLQETISKLFGRQVSVVPLITGTASNALVLSMITRSFGSIICHRDSHIIADEAGAVEFMTRGARLLPLDGPDGKIAIRSCEKISSEDSVHWLRLGALSLSQSTERGTVYSLDQIRALSTFARRREIPLHMDGTRFANAIVATGETPRRLSWESGVNVLSLGATKGGALGAEMAVFFDKEMGHDFIRQVKRTGHLLSRAWVLSLQLLAYFSNGAWLHHAKVANDAALRLAATIANLPDVELAHPVETNMVYLRVSKERAALLQKEGIRFYHWNDGDKCLLRFVTSHATSEENLHLFEQAVKRSYR